MLLFYAIAVFHECLSPYRFTDSEKLSQLTTRLESVEQDLVNAKLDEKLVTINGARIAQVRFQANESAAWSVHW